jgi:hypothetical protein
MSPSSQNTDVTEMVSNISYCAQWWGVGKLRCRVGKFERRGPYSMQFKICEGKFQNPGQKIWQQSGSACVLQVTGGVL